MSKTPGAYNTAKRVPLECGDVLWFRVAAPQWGEKVWCSKCTDMVTVGMPSHAYTLGFMPDYMWECVREPDRWFTGRCVHDPECGLVIRDRDWTRLKAAMERHHLRSHTDSSLRFTEVERTNHVIRLPADATPPF